MKKLIKPIATMEDYSNEMIQALCEYDGCSDNCRTDTIFGCTSVHSDNSEDEDILF